MTPEEKQRTRRLVRNSLTGVLRFIALIPIPFLLVPFMLHRLGTDRFGVWALVGSLAGIVQLGDFGIGLALVKSVAELRSAKAPERMSSVVSTGLMLYSVVAAVMVVLAVPMAGVLVPHAFRIPAPLVNEARFVVTGAVFIFSAALVLGVLTSVLNGLQRTDVANMISFGVTILNAVGVVVVLGLGLGLRGLVINNAFTTLAGGLASWWAMRRLDPGIRLGIGGFRLKEVKPILSYGVNIQITNLAGFCGDPLVRMITSHIAGVQSVAYYDIAMRLVTPIRGVIAQAIAPMMPIAAEANASGDGAGIVTIYRRSVRYILLLVFPFLALTFVAAPALIHAWVGHGYQLSSFTFRVLMVGQSISILSLPCYYIFLATHVRITMLIAVAAGAMDFVACIGLGYFYGYQGVIYGYAATMFGVSSLGIILFWRAFRIDPWSLLRHVRAQRVGWCVLPALLLWGLLICWPRPGIGGLALAGLALGAIYFAYLRISNVLSREEVRYVAEVLRPGRA